MDNGAELYTNYAVQTIAKTADGFQIGAADGRQITARYLVNCAGGHADTIAALAGDRSFEILPRAGEYMLLDKSEGNTVSHTIFQVPTVNGKAFWSRRPQTAILLLGPTGRTGADARKHRNHRSGPGGRSHTGQKECTGRQHPCGHHLLLRRPLLGEKRRFYHTGVRAGKGADPRRCNRLARSVLCCRNSRIYRGAAARERAETAGKSRL